jgi:hypothetical protein
MTSPSLLSDAQMAASVPRWALAFYRRHLALVVGISLIPAAQRVVGQLWGEQLPPSVNGALEMVTAIARVALLVMLVRLAIMAEDRLRRVDWRESLRRVQAFVRIHWRSLLVQVVLLLTATAIFDAVPDRVIAPRVPADAQPAYWAVLLAVKNPTIIAFTMIWQVGIVRQMLLHAVPPTREPRATATT